MFPLIVAYHNGFASSYACLKEIPARRLWQVVVLIQFYEIMISRITALLISVFVLLGYGVILTTKPTFGSQGPPINDAILSTRVAETCPGIQGNSDFYGLGIRIGIYLQWVSSWISNFFNPGKATANHDANTIFLIAVLTAISVSSANGDLMLVEQYIMLLLSYGFVFTVLSFIGLRLHFLQPKTLATFWRELATFCRELADTRGGMGKRGSKVFIFALKPLSWFKHPSLSWAGVFVRAMNGSWLAGLSIFTWMNYSTHLSSNDDDLCVPTLYFFGSRGLSRNLLLLFRVMACLAAAPAVYVFILCCGLAYVLYVSTNQWAIKYYVISLVDKLVEDGWDSLSSEKKIAIGTVIENPGLFSTVFAIAVFAPKLRGMSYLRVLQKISPPWLNIEIQQSPTAEQSDQAEGPSGARYSDGWNIYLADLNTPTEIQQGILSLLVREVEISNHDDNNNKDGDILEKQE